MHFPSWISSCFYHLEFKREVLNGMSGYPLLYDWYSSIPFLLLLLLTHFHIFMLPLRIPKESEIIDGFWHSRCLNNINDLLYMIESFVIGANASLVAKNGTKLPWVKIENSRNFDRDFALFRGQIWLWLFYNLFCVMVLRFYTKNFKSFRPKMKAWRRFFQILILFWIGKINVTSSFFLKMTWNFLSYILEP